MSRRAQVAALLLALLVAACAGPQAPTSKVTVPDKLKPGPNESLMMVVPARGVQIYECRARTDQAGMYDWAFVAPEADLFDTPGRRVQQGHEHTAREYRGWRGAQDRLLSSHGQDSGSRRLHGGLLLLHRQVRRRGVPGSLPEEVPTCRGPHLW